MLGLSLSELITRLITLVVGLSFHEFSHAFVANAFGDDTPRANGRLTLNPLAHLDPVGSLMLILAGFGWAKPVPIDPYNLDRRSPSAVMWVSLAGPFSNFLLAMLAAIPLRFGLVPFTYTSSSQFNLSNFLLEFMYINLLLALFNLIPLYPLDGEKIASYAFPPALGAFLDSIRPYSMYILIALFFVLPYLGVNIFSSMVNPVLTRILSLLLGSNFY
ncbi:MAG TPA: site-2 protease family protein [Longilinea sp.]|nr:site-2 protease family protein [Longilinea sp.]